MLVAVFGPKSQRLNAIEQIKYLVDSVEEIRYDSPTSKERIDTVNRLVDASEDDTQVVLVHTKVPSMMDRRVRLSVNIAIIADNHQLVAATDDEVSVFTEDGKLIPNPEKDLTDDELGKALLKQALGSGK